MARDAADIGVVEVEIAEGCAIGEGREIRCDAVPCANHGRATAAARQYDVAANAHRLSVEGGETAAQYVDEKHFDTFDCRVVEIIIAEAVGVGGEPFREGCVTRF